MTFKPSERIFGFDLIRATATLIIVFHHSSPLFSEHWQLPNSFKFPDPVDLFFVGSGFLVGRIIIQSFIVNNTLSLKDGINFLKRRWYRTFPNYYLFLIINILLLTFGLAPGRLNENAAFYFIFLQNLHQPLDLFFWESWSLVVEEWFYLIYPLALILSYRLFKSNFNAKKAFISITIGLIILPTLYRLLSYDSSLDWDIYYRKLVITRMDTIGFGLLAAYAQIYHFKSFTKYRVFSFITGLVLYLIPSLFFNSWTHYFQSTFFFTTTAIGVTLLFPLLFEWKREKIPYKPFRFISLISYSIYLCHLPLYYITKPWFIGLSQAETVLLYLTYWSMVLSISYLIYRFFENPIMKLRDR